MGLINQFQAGLSKTRQGFVQKVTQIVSGRQAIEEQLYEDLEEALIQADVGVTTALKLVADLRKKARDLKLTEAEQLKSLLEAEITEILSLGNHPLTLTRGTLQVILLVGVNGVGKTTTIGKLSHKLKGQGFRVMVAAADTFRAAAIEQVEVWCQRAGVELIRQNEGSDPAAVVFDALAAAKSRKIDVLIIDTAGRLQTKTNLMEELKKIGRVIEREIASGPVEVLLVLDATTGQNALSQTKLFSEAVQVSGVVLTKLDGTAKGGVILGIQNEYQVPVKFIGTGEAIEQLEEFDPQAFSQALFAEEKGD